MAASASTTVADALSRFRAGEAVEPPAAPAAPKPVPTATTGKGLKRVSFTRPNGEPYFARQVPGAAHDIDLLRTSVGATLTDNLYILAFGEPGTGKTAAIECAHPNLITVEGDDDTDVDQFVGQWVQLPDGSYEWVDGPLIEAAENGVALFIDEIAMINPKVLTSSVYAAMDGRGQFRVKSNPKRGVIKVKPGFTVIGACNPNAPGARMSEALLSRFSVHIEYTTDFDLVKSMGVPPKIVTVAKNLATKKANNEIMWVPQTRNLLDFKKATERWGQDFACANFISTAPVFDRPIVADMVSRQFGAAIAPLRSGEAAMA